MQLLPCINNAWLTIEEGKIAAYGEMNEAVFNNLKSNDMDAKGAYVLPCWCDSHTHLVYASSRENELVDKIKGSSYEEIAAKGGGILNSALKLQQMSEDDLFELASERLIENILNGAGAIEIAAMD